MLAIDVLSNIKSSQHHNGFFPTVTACCLVRRVFRMLQATPHFRQKAILFQGDTLVHLQTVYAQHTPAAPESVVVTTIKYFFNA